MLWSSVGTLCMQEHLEEISKCIDQEKHGLLVLNRATWHTTKKITLPHTISLLPLPPASPELHPVEQIWQRLRDRYLANRSFCSYEHIVECCCQAWNIFTSKLDAIKKLCSRAWSLITGAFGSMVLLPV